jgi:hypothetical protein
VLTLLSRLALRDRERLWLVDLYGPGRVGRPGAPAPRAERATPCDASFSGNGGSTGGLGCRGPPNRPLEDENIRPAMEPPIPGSNAGAALVVFVLIVLLAA